MSIVAAAPYSGFVEFGTVNMAPQPFMRPALAKYRRAFQNDIAEAGAELVGSKTAARAATRGRSQGPFNRTRALSNARGNV